MGCTTNCTGDSGLLIVTTFSVVDLEGPTTRYETNFHLFFPPYTALVRYGTSYKEDLCTVALLSRAEHPRATIEVSHSTSLLSL